MKKHLYKARWAQAGQPSIANVSFESVSDHHAWLQVSRLGRELGVSDTPVDLMCGSRLVPNPDHVPTDPRLSHDD